MVLVQGSCNIITGAEVDVLCSYNLSKEMTNLIMGLISSRLQNVFFYFFPMYHFFLLYIIQGSFSKLSDVTLDCFCLCQKTKLIEILLQLFCRVGR